jgi:hypothetical protein
MVSVLLGATAADWAQFGSAAFTAVAAFAALATVVRAEADRRDRALPDLYVDSVHDLKKGEVRVTVVNYGGPAREVSVAGVEGDFGYAGLVGPTSYWRPGESRTIRLSMPPGQADVANAVVVGRDVRMRFVFATTVGGAKERWRVSRHRVSNEEIFRHFFPAEPSPLQVPGSPIDMETIERAW